MNREVLMEAIQTYGSDHQLNVAIEEMAELTKEICKRKRMANNRNEIIEEMADVLIMLEQLKLIFNISSIELEEQIKFKIARLQERMKENEKKM